MITVTVWRDGAVIDVPADDLGQVGPPVEMIPDRVSNAGWRRALLAADLLDEFEAAFAAASRDVQLQWEYGAEVIRADPATQAIADALGLTAAQLDALFVAASRMP